MSARDIRDYIRDAPASTRDYLRLYLWALDWERDAASIAAGTPTRCTDPLGICCPTAAEDYANLINSARALRDLLRKTTR